MKELASLKTDYVTLLGWESDICGVTDYDKLTQNCRSFIQTIEELINVPITCIGTDPDREQMIM